MKRYEQSIRVITGFFAVLLGFGLKKLLDAPSFDPANARWPCFLMSVFLFLRFLLGSNNHMWVEFVSDDRGPTIGSKVSHKQVLNDFLFLVLFGLIGMGICYSTTLDEFLSLNLLFTGAAFVWAMVHAGISRRAGKKMRPPIGDWSYWRWVNLAQFFSILVVKYVIIPCKCGAIPWWPSFFPGPAWDWSVLILVVVYLVIFAWDFLEQLKILEGLKEKPAVAAKSSVAPEIPSGE